MIGPVVVGYDGSAGSEAALVWAAGEAERLQTVLRIVHAPPWPARCVYDDYEVLRILQALVSAAEETLNDAVRRVQARHPDLEIKLVATVGDEATVLPREARDGAMLVVGGSRPR